MCVAMDDARRQPPRDPTELFLYFVAAPMKITQKVGGSKPELRPRPLLQLGGLLSWERPSRVDAPAEPFNRRPTWQRNIELLKAV